MYFDAQPYKERTINGRIYLEILENWLMPQMNEDSDDYELQEDGCPGHFHNEGTRQSQHKFARILGRTLGEEDVTIMGWPPTSPDLTPCYFLLWGFVKDTVFVPPVPANL